MTTECSATTPNVAGESWPRITYHNTYCSRKTPTTCYLKKILSNDTKVIRTQTHIRICYQMCYLLSSACVCPSARMMDCFVCSSNTFWLELRVRVSVCVFTLGVEFVRRSELEHTVRFGLWAKTEFDKLCHHVRQTSQPASKTMR